MTPLFKEKKNLGEILIFSFILIGTYLTSFYNYLLFHTLSELFSIIVAGGIFVIAWNSRKYMENSFFSILGYSFLFFGFIDIIHTLAYKGMNIFMDYGANPAAQLWIAARYLQAGSFLFAFYGLERRIDNKKILLGYSIITFLLITSVFSGIFPVCYIEDIGLTPFKIISEYIIISMFAGTIILIHNFHYKFDKRIYKLLITSIILTIISEFSFTAYISVYEFITILGHLFKITSYIVLYLAIISIGLENPFNLLFNKSKVSEEKYRNLIQESLEGVWFIDSQAVTTLVNESMAKMLGYTIEEMIGKPVPFFMDEDTKKLFQSKFNERKKGIADIFDIEFLHKNGYKIYALLKANPIYNDDGLFNGAIAFVTDLTDRKRAEEQLTQFVSTVSHELRTPITVLMMSIEYLNKFKEKTDQQVIEKLMDAISRNINILNELVEDLLLLSKIDDKKVGFEWREYDCLDVINEILILMDIKLKEKQMTVNNDIPKGINLIGDLKRIDQIFRIFIDNSIKYSKNNTKIELRAVDHYKGKYNKRKVDGVLFQIIDYGIGIAKKDLPYIFKRFYRSEDVKEIPGTGLGLPIAKEFILLHEGEVYVESKLGQGSTFYVFLPRFNANRH
jgi:PAS domain S-box-containing protein